MPSSTQPHGPSGSLRLLLLSKHILDDYGIARLPPGARVVVFNTESIWHYFKDGRYRDYVRSCTHVAIDGIGLAKAIGLLGDAVPRFHGPELLSAIVASKHRWTLVLAGGSPKNATLVNQGIVDRFIALPFTDDVSVLRDTILNELSSGPPPDRPVALLLSLGLPKQEMLAGDLHACFGGRFPGWPALTVVPVGAAVDFLTGHRRRAGATWRRMGLEWLPRMIREPRMIPRVARSLLAIVLLFRSELRCRLREKI